MDQSATKQPWRVSQIDEGKPAHWPGEAFPQSGVTSDKNLKFINVSGPGDAGDISTRSEIRRHVMMDYVRQQHRGPRTATRAAPPATMVFTWGRERARAARDQLGHSPGRSLPPLGGFPVRGDTRMLELVRFANEQQIQYVPFRGLWFEVSLRDPGAFHATLGNAALFWKTSTHESDPINSREVVKYYSKSLTHLQHSLNSPDKCTALETIANVMAHICISVRDRNWQAWGVHMDGLGEISKSRGGLVDLPHKMRIMILMHDLAGSMVADAIPRFPLPPKLEKRNEPHAAVPSRIARTLIELGLNPIEDDLIFEALEQLSSVVNVVNLESHSDSFWRRDVDAAELVGPCIHFLLSMPRMPPMDNNRPRDSITIVREMVRLVCLMVMSKLKAKFSLVSSEWNTLQTRFIHFVMSNLQDLRREHTRIIIWGLVTASLLEHFLYTELCLDKIVTLLFTADMGGAKDPIRVAKEILWVNVLESPFEEGLEKEIELRMAGAHDKLSN